MSRRVAIMNGVGLGCLVLAYLYSTVVVWQRQTSAAKPAAPPVASHAAAVDTSNPAPKTVVRFAHAQLERGMREAFDALARDYMASHPSVVIEQIAVPRRVWASWLETRLTGGNAPDLVQLVDNDPARILQHFTPIGRWMQLPNPYNAGTPLEGLPWRDTFVAPLTEPPSYWPLFLDYYGVPLTLFTIRIYYNRELLREITGSDRTPATYEELIALCRTVQAWPGRNGTKVHPIAGTRLAPPFDALFDRILSSQTQTMTPVVDRTFGLGGGRNVRGFARDAYFDRVWTLRHPAVQSGLTLIKELGQFFQPGFLQSERDQAVFYFLQQRALMTASGSWDYASISHEAPFSVGVFPIPLPDATQPRYRPFMYGPISEADTLMRAAFALTKTSTAPDAAVDFLRFLTSAEAHQKFSNLSGWLPSVSGVKPAEPIQAFFPVQEGYLGGFQFKNGVDSMRLWETSAHLLFATPDGVERFTRALEPIFDRSMVINEKREVRELPAVIGNYDLQLAAELGRSLTGQPALLAPQKLSELLEVQTFQEATLLRSHHQLERFKPQP